MPYLLLDIYNCFEKRLQFFHTEDMCSIGGTNRPNMTNQKKKLNILSQSILIYQGMNLKNPKNIYKNLYKSLSKKYRALGKYFYPFSNKN